MPVRPMNDIFQSFLAQDIAAPMLSSLVTGLLIGLDREVRGKPAGLRTHALVCFAATILTLAAARQGEWTANFMPGTQLVSDPSRMAHGILTGIGFLGAGVIFREGASVHGLTTAASLWIASALGIVYGVGMYWLAVAGTAATLIVLVVMRIIFALLPVRSEIRLRVIVAGSSGFGAAELREILRREGLRIRAVSRSHSRPNDRLELGASAYCRSEAGADRLAEALLRTEAVLAFSIIPAEDPAGQMLHTGIGHRHL
ncbi:putative Mg2+ transporter-C (MgtC) family protein [Cereibacter ovatus]|uniref:Protein MgtC n=2 Tax=Cereibacter ovatus TaxID=439529 RepID=A0A285CKT1_9RHOB|nr:putative Mg2+ transporter-C (MgtC) family protein [Cereibacter ovatus]